MATNQKFMSVKYACEVNGVSRSEICQKVIGQVHQIGNPDIEAGESWDDVPVVRITHARIETTNFPQFPQGYIIVDTEEV